VTQKSIKLLFFLSVLLVSGCKLAVINVEGGEVQSTGSGTCVAGTVCLVDVADTNFSETFTAVPDEGWYFHKWNQGGRFFCGNSFNPECSLSFEGLQGEEKIETLVASSEVFYLMPVFRPIEPDDVVVEGRTVIVDGREWLQPVDFIGYSYDEVKRVCPEGACSGTLPRSTKDLTGYFWASKSDVELLFQSYRSVGRPVSKDFEKTADEGSRIPYILYVILSDRPSHQQDVDEPVIYLAVVTGDGIDTANESREIDPTHVGTNDQSDIFGQWFWRPVD